MIKKCIKNTRRYAQKQQKYKYMYKSGKTMFYNSKKIARIRGMVKK